METNKFDGLVILDNNEYPYSIAENEVFVYFGKDGIVLPENYDKLIVRKVNEYDKCNLIKIYPAFINGALELKKEGTIYKSSSVAKSEVEYIVNNYKKDIKYNQILFTFNELDYFYPSYYSIVDDKECETLIFDRIKYNGTNIKLEFCLEDVNDKCYPTSSIVRKTFLKVSFKKTNDLNYILGIYYSIRHLFSFIFNRSNISLNSLYLKEIKKGKTSYQSLVSVYDKFILDPEEVIKQEKQITIGLYINKFKDLIQLFFQKEKDEEIIPNLSIINESRKKKSLIDLKQTLSNTAVFENYVNYLLPKMSSEDSLEFYEDVKKWLDKYIDEHTGKKAKKAKEFKKIVKPNISLADKITKIYKGYSDWNTLKPVLKKWYGKDVSKLANELNEWRNELAHCKNNYELKRDTIIATQLVEHINYCIILRQANYTDDEIRNILEPTLNRF